MFKINIKDRKQQKYNAKIIKKCSHLCLMASILSQMHFVPVAHTFTFTFTHNDAFSHHFIATFHSLSFHLHLHPFCPLKSFKKRRRRHGHTHKVLGIFQRLYKKHRWKGEWFCLFSNEVERCTHTHGWALAETRAAAGAGLPSALTLHQVTEWRVHCPRQGGKEWWKMFLSESSSVIQGGEGGGRQLATASLRASTHTLIYVCVCFWAPPKIQGSS